MNYANNIGTRYLALNRIQPLTLCVYFLMQSVVGQLKCDLGESRLTIDSRDNHVKSASLIPESMIHNKSVEDAKRNVFPDKSMFGETFTLELIFFIKLVIVFDSTGQQYFNNDEKLTADYVYSLVYQLNRRFNLLSLSVVLIDYVVLDEGIKLNGQNFQAYRDANLTQYQNYHVSFLQYNIGPAIGASHVLYFCTKKYSTTFVSLTFNDTNWVAFYLARQLGFTMGFSEHGIEGCTCEGNENICVMSANYTDKAPLVWSSCSVDNLLQLFTAGELDCLLDPPSTRKEYCGNGVIEGQETCDCGSPNCGACCNGATCTLMPNAVCGSGPCCDTSTCLPFVKNFVVCRNNFSECDLPEVCDGESAECPENIYVHDGFPCSLGGYCYNGFCRSQSLSCKSIFFEEAEKGANECFGQNSINGSEIFNCAFINDQFYIPCNANNVECGKLFCDAGDTRDDARIADRTVKDVKVNGHRCVYLTTPLDSIRYVSYVANGSPCGIHSLCVSAVCTPLTDVKSIKPCPSECSGHGFCDNQGQCHCHNGYSSIDCSVEALPIAISTLVLVAVALVVVIVAAAIYFYGINLLVTPRLRIEEVSSKRSYSYSR